MILRLCTRAACGVALVATGAALMATAPDPIAVRQAGFHKLGEAFKSVNDALRSGDIKPAAMAPAAHAIQAAAHQQYGWFPAGSGPRPGVKTAARPDIWAKPALFKADQDALAAQADVFARAVDGGDPAVIRTEGRKLGATCKTCHDAFRVSDD